MNSIESSLSLPEIGSNVKKFFNLFEIEELYRGNQKNIYILICLVISNSCTTLILFNQSGICKYSIWLKIKFSLYSVLKFGGGQD